MHDFINLKVQNYNEQNKLVKIELDEQIKLSSHAS